MPTQTPSDELAEVRAQIARLRAREAELSSLLLLLPSEPLPRTRPGWPIRRQPSGDGASLRH